MSRPTKEPNDDSNATSDTLQDGTSDASSAGTHTPAPTVTQIVKVLHNISEISAASGIVLDSSPKKEFNENFIKAKSLLDLYK